MLGKLKYLILKKYSMKYRRYISVKDKFDFDYEKEQLIYDYLYLRELRKKDIKKLKRYNISDHVSYSTYKEWAGYVKNKYCIYNKDSLIEFLRFLRHRARINNSYNNMIISFVSPLLVAIIANYIINSFGTINNILLFVFVFIIVFAYMFCYIALKIKELTDGAEQQKGLYNDYIEIIEELIKKKS